MPPKPPAVDLDPLAAAVRRALGQRKPAGVVVVLTEDGRRAVVEDRAKLASKLQRSDPGVAWWLSGETCGPGECLALVAVDGILQVVRVRVEAGGRGGEE